jgi:hypothetical protein
MSENYPLYPKLTEKADEEARDLISSFKQKLVIAAEEAISEMYSDVLPYIESDAWGNFRNELMEVFGIMRTARFELLMISKP